MNTKHDREINNLIELVQEQLDLSMLDNKDSNSAVRIRKINDTLHAVLKENEQMKQDLQEIDELLADADFGEESPSFSRAADIAAKYYEI